MDDVGDKNIIYLFVDLIGALLVIYIHKLCVYIHTYMHTYIQTKVNTFLFHRTHICKHINIHSIHTYCTYIHIHTYIHSPPLNGGEPERHGLCDEIPDDLAEVSLQLCERLDLLGTVEEHVELLIQVHCMYVLCMYIVVCMYVCIL